MELKVWLWGSIRKGVAVLIVPLWNWKIAFSDIICNTFLVLIVPLWNWKEGEDYYTYIYTFRFNRTFMELKVNPHWHILIFSDSDVLIVPLWNWKSAVIIWYAGVLMF